MAYILSKSNNETLVVLNDGQINNNLTSLTLVGKNVSNYGDAQNENFLHLLENFANSSQVGGQPRSPIKGQIWFDSNPQVNRPLVYDGSKWRPLAASIYGTTHTNSLINALSVPPVPFGVSQPGDFFVNSQTKQLFVVTNTASDVALIGPEAVNGFDTTRMVSAAMYDITGQARPVIQTIVNGEIVSIQSNASFVQTATNAIVGFPNIYRGLTFKNYNTSTRYSTSTSDVVLYGLHDQLDASYTRRNINEHIESSWYIDSGNALYFGTTGQTHLSYNSGNNSLAIVSSTGSVSMQSGANSIVFDGDSLKPSSNLIDLAENNLPFNSIYVKMLSSGSSQGSIEGIWNLKQSSQFNPYQDLGNDIGTSSLKFANVYTAKLSAGSSTSSGVLSGRWALDLNSNISPSSSLANDLGQPSNLFRVVYASTLSGLTAIIGSPLVTGNIIPSADSTYRLGDSNRSWSDLYATNVRATSLFASSISLTSGTISLLNASTATITNLQASSAEVGSLTSTGTISGSAVFVGPWPVLTSTFVLSTATNSSVGGVRIGAGVNISSSGTISVVTYNQSLNTTDNVRFNNLQASNITATTVLTASEASITTLNAATIAANSSLTAANASFATATVASLFASITSISTATVSNLTVSNATITILNAVGGTANNFTVSNNLTVGNNINVTGNVVSLGNVSAPTASFNNVAVSANVVAGGNVQGLLGTFTSITALGNTNFSSGTQNIRDVVEQVTLVGTAFSGQVDINTIGNSLVYNTANSTGNWSLNFRGNGSTTLNSYLSIGQAVTVTILVTQGGTGFYPTSCRIDGVTVTPKWFGGVAPTSGDANGVNAYTFTILKTANATYSLFASVTKYA